MTFFFVYRTARFPWSAAVRGRVRRLRSTLCRHFTGAQRHMQGAGRLCLPSLIPILGELMVYSVLLSASGPQVDSRRCATLGE